jgi:hypothetical protein
MVAEEVLVNCYNFKPITHGIGYLRQKKIFQGILKNYLALGLEPELEPEPRIFGSARLV